MLSASHIPDWILGKLELQKHQQEQTKIPYRSLLSTNVIRTGDAKQDRKPLDNNQTPQENTAAPPLLLPAKVSSLDSPSCWAVAMYPNLPIVVVSEKATQGARISSPTGSNIREGGKKPLVSQPTPCKVWLCLLPLGPIQFPPFNKSSA